MRVALNGWFWQKPETGSGQYLRALVAALARLNAEVDWGVFLPGSPPFPGQGGAVPPGVALISLPAFDRGAGLVRHARKVWWEQRAMPAAARRWGADMVHVPYWAPPVGVPGGIPVVVTVHDLIPLLLPAYRGNALARLYTALVCATTPRASVLLTDSESARADILAHLRVPAGRVRAIPLAVDARYQPEPAPDDAEILAALDLAPGYVLYLGGFDVRKNLRVAFAAFAAVRRALPEARIVVAGKLLATDTAFAPDPRRLAREAGVPSEATRFVDFVPEASKPALYRGARAFIFPSRYEGFGLPPLEALACGTPVVGSDAASMPQVVGDAGVLTAPDDHAGMAGALIQLLSDAAFHAEMRRRAVRQAARFSWATTAQQTMAVYRQVGADHF